MVVSVDRWSLYRGAVVSLKWSVDQPTVVSVDRWSFHTGGLQEFHFTPDKEYFLFGRLWYPLTKFFGAHIQHKAHTYISAFSRTNRR